MCMGHGDHLSFEHQATQFPWATILLPFLKRAGPTIPVQSPAWLPGYFAAGSYT